MESIRYREKTGSTQKNIVAAKRHIPTLGELYHIRGYVHKSRYVNKAAVMVTGSFGTARFSGFSWGYKGTGPQALKQLLLDLGFANETAENIAFNTPWEDSIGEKWRLPIKSKVIGWFSHSEFTRSFNGPHGKLQNFAVYSTPTGDYAIVTYADYDRSSAPDHDAIAVGEVCECLFSQSTPISALSKLDNTKLILALRRQNLQLGDLVSNGSCYRKYNF